MKPGDVVRMYWGPAVVERVRTRTRTATRYRDGVRHEAGTRYTQALIKTARGMPTWVTITGETTK